MGQVADLCALDKRDGWLEIGAAATLEQAYAFLAEDYPEPVSYTHLTLPTKA
uniref:Uncharacterized protein n=1 Tax=Ralstonia solanacearum TaxID=305 RepID=A0A0S4W8G7_RALSL|nr:protein of unknown function [Ralstonia solanacearum]